MLYSNGKIEYNYATMDPGTGVFTSSSIGIEDAAGTDGLQVVFNAAYMHSNLSIRFNSGWLFAAPASGNVAPGGNTSATITFDATNLNIGTFSGLINLDSNDPETPNIDIPVTFNVGTGGTPNIIVTPATLRDTLNINQTANHDLKIKNTGDGTLAVTFADSAAWITIPGGPRYVSPGDSLFHTFTLAGAGLAPGTYTSRIVVTSNDPDTPNSLVTVTLFMPTPNIVVTPSGISDTLVSGENAIHNLKVKNTAVGTLEVTFSDSADWISVPPGPYYIAIGDSLMQPVTLDATGLLPGTYTSRVVSTSNDPDTPNIITNVTLFVPSPNIAVTPTSISDTLAPGSTATHYLNINNTGQGLLNFGVATYTNNLLLDDGSIIPVSIKPVAEQPFTIINRPESEPKVVSGGGPVNPPQLLSQGGPDIFGHRWIDSDEVGGPTYNWVDITAVGTPITGLGDDTNVGPFAIGFDVGFYGMPYNTFRFCTNGFISFTSSATDYSNLGLPNISAPLDLMAAFWDDLNFNIGGAAYYYTNNTDSLVISWIDVPHYSSGGPYTFQIIVLANGSIFYQYQTINTPDNSCTIGIQNFDGSDGLQVVWDATYVHSAMAIKFTTSWLSASPTSGMVGPGGLVQVGVTLDATSIAPGTHTGNVVISSNDPDTPVINVPVTLLVEGIAAPEIEIPVSAITDTLSPGSQTIFNLVIRNRGGADLWAYLNATELTLGLANEKGTQDDPPQPQNIWLFVTPPADTIGGGDSLIAQVTLNAGSVAPGTHTGHVSIASNDADESNISIPVTLLVQATGEPDINPSVVAFTDTVITGGSKIKTLYLGNTGGSMLYYGLHDNRAWISVVPDTGNVPTTATDTITVTFNASALTPGSYTGQLNVNSNDADEGLIIMPVNLLVTSGGGGCVYVPGDINNNGSANGIDVVYGVNYFKGSNPPPVDCGGICPQASPFYAAGDVNGNCSFNGIDVTFFVNFLKGIQPALLVCPTCPPATPAASVPGEKVISISE